MNQEGGAPPADGGDEIQFLIPQKIGETIEYNCPDCGVEGKIIFGKFQEQYVEVNCPCKEVLLLKLEFVPTIKIFKPTEEN